MSSASERFALVRSRVSCLTGECDLDLVMPEPGNFGRAERIIATGTYEACRAAQRLMEMRDG